MKPNLPNPEADPQAGHARSSRRRYLGFVRDYQQGQLDDDESENGGPPGSAKPKEADTKPDAATRKARRREYLREYGRWLWPHRFAIGTLFALALVAAGLELIEPLFMRYIVDHVLLETGLDQAERLRLLSWAGGLFVAVVVLARLVGAVKDYRQRLVNVHVMLSAPHVVRPAAAPAPAPPVGHEDRRHSLAPDR